jgi:hypothetical protein
VPARRGPSPMVQAAVVAQGEGAGLVDAVVSDFAVWADVWAGGFGSGGVGLGGCAAADRSVGPRVVEADPESAEFDLEYDPAAAAGCAGENGAVVGEHAGGDSPLHKGMLKGAEDIGAGDAAPHVAAEGAAGVVVEEVENLDVGAVGELPVGGVGLPAFVRLLGRDRRHDDRGHFWGWGVKKPRRVKTRQIVETAGTVQTAAAAEVGVPALHGWIRQSFKTKMVVRVRYFAVSRFCVAGDWSG